MLCTQLMQRALLPLIKCRHCRICNRDAWTTLHITNWQQWQLMGGWSMQTNSHCLADLSKCKVGHYIVLILLRNVAVRSACPPVACLAWYFFSVYCQTDCFHTQIMPHNQWYPSSWDILENESLIGVNHYTSLWAQGSLKTCSQNLCFHKSHIHNNLVFALNVKCSNYSMNTFEL